MRRTRHQRRPTLSAAIHGCSLVLAHAPDLVRHGSKPTREDAADEIKPALRTFEDALGYPPHQVFIGNLTPDALWEIERPWWRSPAEPRAQGPYGVVLVAYRSTEQCHERVTRELLDVTAMTSDDSAQARDDRIDDLEELLRVEPFRERSEPGHVRE